MKTCITCGMPLEGEHIGQIGLETDDGLVCSFDTKDGFMKSPEEIFNGGVEFFVSSVAPDRSLAERLVRKNMNSLAYWQAHPFALLDGPLATEEEFAAAMSKL